MLRNAGGSQLLALRGVTGGRAGVIFVKICVTYFLNSPKVLTVMMYFGKFCDKLICSLYFAI